MKNLNLISRLAVGAAAVVMVAGCGTKEESELAVATETAATEVAATPAPAATAVAYETLKGDPVRGGQVFVKCKACHVFEAGQNRVGPSLHAVIGNIAGTVAGFTYSEANKKSGIVWSEAELFTYLENPQKKVPGTKMAFAGLPKAQDRADVIAYLKANGS